MLDIGWQELFVIAVLTLIVVGPKDLPHALRAVTRGIRRVRGLAQEFQSGIDDMVREAELDDIRQQVNKVTRGSLADSVKREIDPQGELTEDFDPRAYSRDIEEGLKGQPETAAQSTANTKAAANTDKSSPATGKDDDLAAGTARPGQEQQQASG